MSYDVEDDGDKTAGDYSKRKKLFWILVVGIFLTIVVIWLAFFGNTIFSINTDESGSYIQRAGQYWSEIKGNFSKQLEQIMTTPISNETSTAGQSTSTQ